MNSKSSQDENFLLEQFKNDEKYSALIELYKEKCEELRLLHEQHEKLKYEFSENTIVQSMNAMKEQYEELIASTVSKFRYDVLNEQLQHINRIIITCSVILERITTNVQKISERFVYNGQNKLELQKVGFELSMLLEILMESNDINQMI